MNLWSWIGRRIGLTTNAFWSQWGGTPDSGEPVTAEKLTGLAAYMRGVRLYATTISTLPIGVYEQPPTGDPVLIRDPANQYDRLLRLSPNEDQTASEFLEGVVGSECLVGNGYARKHRIGSRITALEPLDGQATYPFRVRETNELRYRSIDSQGNNLDLPAREVFHLKGFSFGGDAGVSPVQAAANSIGNLISANKASGKMLRSGLSSSGFLETGAVLNQPDRDRLTKIMSDYAGSDNAGKLMILEGGMKYNRLSLSAVDAQLLLTIGFGIEEVARWLDMPPILLGHNSSGGTMWGSGVESIIGAWYTLGLRAKIKRVENALNKRLIEPKDFGRFYYKFNVDGLLRGDSAAQAALFSAAAQNGWLTRNEIRKLLDLAPLPGGDDLTVQVNLTLLKDLGSANQRVAQDAKLALLTLLGITPEMLEDKKRPAPVPAPAPAGDA